MSKKAEKESLELIPVETYMDAIGCYEDYNQEIRSYFTMGYDKAVEDVFAYLKNHYLLRSTEIPMRWVAHEKVKQNFYENE